MDKTITIALAGNPNSGKTTLFNALTGANQYVGNWPGVTVEKKEGRLRGHRNVVLADLPGIYSLSPYTLEEVIARNYLLEERPDAIINIVDGTNLERNLYLTTQLLELGIPVVVALNLIDVVRRSPNKIDTAALAEELGCPVVEVSALKGIGIDEVTALAVDAATGKAAADCAAADATSVASNAVATDSDADKPGGAGVAAAGGPGAAAGCKCRQKNIPRHTFSGVVEHALAHIEEEVLHDLPLERQRWFAIKLFERDEMAQELLETELKAAGLPPLSEKQRAHIETDICRAEAELDDDAESIITGERYEYISRILLRCYDKRDHGRLSTSDKIDRVVTNRWAALPIFAAVMFLIYYLSIVTIGTWATDWANDGLFGDGFHVFGRGAAEFAAAEEAYERPGAIKEAFLEAAVEAGAVEQSASSEEDEEIVLIPDKARAVTAVAVLHDEDGGVLEEIPVDYDAYLAVADVEEPDPADFGTWARGIPVIVEGWLESANAAPWLKDLIVHGIIAGVGAVLGFVPQMIVLFL
ncbi:MAG: hypothetical protein GX900_07460, partial [Clostridiaceae bacterium]|nr:hypothetical protein [Clostridiaceae bacterium]